MGVECRVSGKLVESGLEGLRDREVALLHRVQDRHERLERLRPGIGLGAEADLPGDDEVAQVAFGQVVVRGDVAVVGPVVESVAVLSEDVLDLLDRGMVRVAMCDLDDPALEPGRLLIELGVTQE